MQNYPVCKELMNMVELFSHLTCFNRYWKWKLFTWNQVTIAPYKSGISPWKYTLLVPFFWYKNYLKMLSAKFISCWQRMKMYCPTKNMHDSFLIRSHNMQTYEFTLSIETDRPEQSAYRSPAQKVVSDWGLHILPLNQQFSDTPTWNVQILPYLPYVFGQTGLSKQSRPKWDTAECGFSSGSTLFVTHQAIFNIW